MTLSQGILDTLQGEHLEGQDEALGNGGDKERGLRRGDPAHHGLTQRETEAVEVK